MSEVEVVIKEAISARDTFRNWRPADIVRLLNEVADNLDGAASELIKLAMHETNLPEVRLTGEVSRMSGQWRHMAAALNKGENQNVVKDPADNSLQPPRPDLRKTSLPIGIVGVFGASNFPFAFGVGGCDTVSAIAAGCPVIIKSHPGHPQTSRRVFELICESVKKAGGPTGLVNLVERFDSGIDLVKNEEVSAVAFTGSTMGGRALFDLAQSRKNPIPFYGELGGLNPIFVTEEAAKAQSQSIAKGFLESVSMGSGQFCTKPGFLVTIGAVKIKEEILNLISTTKTHLMLNESIRAAYENNLQNYLDLGFANLLARAQSTDDKVEPTTIIEISGSDLLANVNEALQEIFGPMAVIVDCADTNELLQVARAFHGTLASGVHGEPTDNVIENGLLAALERISGRIIWNGWPTGVAVTWAMHHGGPYPATTNPLFTSVGADSMKRFRRPITYQNFPQALLPVHLRD
ncbi:MAG: aldehyde dehydrogenase (NADP(+)) [Actinobacteria bacterium]|nr:aldehyde dehydrogenase (NADP(+)) [Actinomycetota bacterium]